ncbi:probable amidase At4g34880 [Miscanthus floridulus]|uniref:probable amidase At4g34880 n=1 Tax=Miscanthus floridulus TaxID=154761 RepID=UPI00345B0A44
MAWQRLLLLAAAVALTVTAGGAAFQFEEATLESIQDGFKKGSLTSTALVRYYLDQIARLNPMLHAVIEVNPDALRDAARADAERASGAYRQASSSGGGLLHGVPVMVKDLITTRDRLNTTAGSFALLGSVARRDAGVVARLRRAGAIVLGKSNLPEWGNMRSARGLHGWSARGGQAMNPYVLEMDPCEASTGSAIAAAANMAAVTLGTETIASILCPASVNAVVGIKPTVGLTSRSGVIPFTLRQDTVGPLCRTVADAVHVLDAIVGYDALDAEATMAASQYIPKGGYKQFLKIDGLSSKRIGIPNGFFHFETKTVMTTVYKQHIETMRRLGAIVIENLDIENLSESRDTTKSGFLVAAPAEFKINLNNYLSDLSYTPVGSLAEIIAFNAIHPFEEKLIEYDQQLLLLSETTTGIGPLERAAIHRMEELSANGVEKLIKEHQLDAIFTPDSSVATVLAYNGLPGIEVPAGYDEKGVPFGVTFGGLRGYEPRLIEMAYAFEQATKVRRPPII